MHRRSRHATLLVTILALAACAGTESGSDRPQDSAEAGSARAQGDDAMDFEGSKAVWDAARARGVSFRAVGQEPGWVVEVHPRRSIHVLADYGQLEFDAPWTEPVRGDDGALTYTTATDEHSVRIVVRDVACSDTMSGEEFPQAVVLELDGRALYGCGRTLE